MNGSARLWRKVAVLRNFIAAAVAGSVTMLLVGFLLYGIVFSFLMAIGYGLAQFGTSHLWTLKATLVDPFITAVLAGSAGGMIGTVLGPNAAD